MLWRAARSWVSPGAGIWKDCGLQGDEGSALDVRKLGAFAHLASAPFDLILMNYR